MSIKYQTQSHKFTQNLCFKIRNGREPRLGKCTFRREFLIVCVTAASDIHDIICYYKIVCRPIYDVYARVMAKRVTHIITIIDNNMYD
jgi:hypothetical protein